MSDIYEKALKGYYKQQIVNGRNHQLGHGIVFEKSYIDHRQTGNTKMVKSQNTPYETMYKYNGVPDNRLPVIYDMAQR